MNGIKLNLTDYRILMFLPVLIAGLFYYNAIPGEYVLDDGLVLNRNEFVKKGFSGIADILMHDSFYGSVGKIANLNGGRYRPLSLVTYAIEHQFYGLNPKYSRAVNVGLYMFTALLLFMFLYRFIFVGNGIASCLATMLFIMHPIHTEVVANIKSRDELLSLIFIVSSLYLLFDYVRHHASFIRLIASIGCFVLALLSKENAIIFIVMIPATLYLMLHIRGIKIINLSLPYWSVIIAYILIRFALVGFQQQRVTELMDNPYLLANNEQKFATIILVLMKYLKLLVYPHPLSYDYGYNQIPYTTFADWRVLLSVMLHLALLAVVFFTYKKYPLYSWCILFHLAGIFIVSNIVINIGAPMGERFLYQSSLFFIIVLVQLGQKIRLVLPVAGIRTALLSAMLLPVMFLCFKQTQARNEVWVVGTRLGLTDVKTVPNSARALTYAGINLTALAIEERDSVKKVQLLQQALVYLDRALEIHPVFGKASQSKGLCYFYLKDYKRAGDTWLQTQQMNVGIGENVDALLKSVADIYFYYGMKAGADKDFRKSISQFKQAIAYKPDMPEVWYNMGGAYFTVFNYDSAKLCFETALRYKPDMTDAQFGLNALIENGLVKPPVKKVE